MLVLKRWKLSGSCQTSRSWRNGVQIRPPSILGDWVICLHPHMADLSSTSEMWWDLTLSTARAWYDNHMKLSPIQRLTNAPQTTPELQQKKWSRLERRASSLLLGALPESLKEEVIASKANYCTGHPGQGDVAVPAWWSHGAICHSCST